MSNTRLNRMSSLNQIVDLDRYPLDRLDLPEGEALIGRCRRSLTQTGACQLHGFVRPEAVTRLVAEADSLRPSSHRTDDTHNVYFEPIDDEPAAGDVQRRLQRSAKFTVGHDRIGPHSPLRLLYQTDEMTAFVAGALGVAELYRDADPAGALSFAIFERGDELGWHFDRSEFAVTLMLQPSPAGGSYQYVQDLRSPHDENRDAVADVLDGDQASVVTLHNRPGTLSLFRGRYSIHRVTPNQSDTPRINAVLAYAQIRDHRLNAVTRELFYGSPA
jgi:hypothetical protein